MDEGASMMKIGTWALGAVAAAILVAATTTRTTAEQTPVPAWVVPGACFVGNAGTEVVLEVQGAWVKTAKYDSGSEDWRNLQATPHLRRLGADECAQRRK
jgi:hypothetical protein